MDVGTEKTKMMGAFREYSHATEDAECIGRYSCYY